MTITYKQHSGTTDSITTSPWGSGYSVPGNPLRVGNICQANNISETKSVSTLTAIEPDLNPYECMRGSGGLAFWEGPEEDIYTFDDGQPA